MRRGLLGALLALLIFAQPAGAQAGRLAATIGDEIWLMRADGSERQRLTRTPGPAGATQPDFSPDGSALAYARGEGRTSIWTRKAGEGSDRRLTRPPRIGLDWYPDWRADGQTIAFARLRIDGDRVRSSLMTIDVRSGRGRRLKSLTSGRRLLLLTEPAWSPDGTRLLYTVTSLDEESRFKPALYVLDVASGKATRLAATAQSGAWSPDGQRIAFSSVHDATAQSCGSDECGLRGALSTMNADGSGLTRLTQHDGYDTAPAWAPDGSTIAFQSSRNAPASDSFELYVIRPDGSCLTWLTNGTQDSAEPDWQPGTGGLPEPFACGAVPREPTGLVTPRGRGLWMGPIAPRNVLLGHAEHGFLSYDDCAVFEPSECGPAVDMENNGVCGHHPLLNTPQPDDKIELRRGGLLYQGFDNGLQVFSGETVTELLGPDAVAAEAAIDALRPLPSPDPVESLPPPRFPARVIARIEQARRLGSVPQIVRRMDVSRSDARRLLSLAQALEPLGKLQPADCSRQRR